MSSFFEKRAMIFGRVSGEMSFTIFRQRNWKKLEFGSIKSILSKRYVSLLMILEKINMKSFNLKKTNLFMEEINKKNVLEMVGLGNSHLTNQLGW